MPNEKVNLGSLCSWNAQILVIREMLKFHSLTKPQKFQSAKAFSFKVQKHNVFLWYSVFNKRQVNPIQNILLSLHVFLSFWINVRIKSARAIWCLLSIAFMLLNLRLGLLVINFAISPHFTNVMKDKTTINNNRDSLKFKVHHFS